MSTNKVWTREFTSMTIINSMFTIIFFLFIVTITPYAKEQFHVSISTAGLAASVFVIGSLFGRILAGGWITTYGATKVLELSLLFFIITSACYFLSFTIELLLAVRILQGFTTGVISTATGTVSMQAIPLSRRAEGIAYYSFSAVIGAAVGPFLGIFFLSLQGGYQWIFVINLMIGIISYTILLMTKKHISSIPKPASVQRSRFSWNHIIEVQAIPISLIALLFGFCFSSVTSYLVTYSEHIHLVKIASYYFFIHSVCMICTRFFTGKWIDAKGANIVLYPCLLLFSAGLLLYSQATVAWMFLLAAACMSTGFGNFNTGAQTLAVRFSEPHRLGIATATYFMCMDIGTGLGPYVHGLIIEQLGYRPLYLIVSMVGMCCLPLYYYCYGRKEKATLQAQQNVPAHPS